MSRPLGRVLVIEDDPDIAQILASALVHMGASTVTVELKGDEGLERGLEEPFDLALVDLLLPGKDGFDVVQRLRERYPRGTCALVFLTSASRGIDARVVRMTGADGLIRKPFSLAELQGRLQEILASIAPS